MLSTQFAGSPRSSQSSSGGQSLDFHLPVAAETALALCQHALELHQYNGIQAAATSLRTKSIKTGTTVRVFVEPAGHGGTMLTVSASPSRVGAADRIKLHAAITIIVETVRKLYEQRLGDLLSAHAPSGPGAGAL